MYLWIALFSLFLPTQPAMTSVHAAAAEPAIEAPLRYRGIERLLAKFDAESDRDADAPQKR
ncbi:MAG: hypothetical protein U0168_32145 [Nannocystaceae bacterium]